MRSQPELIRKQLYQSAPVIVPSLLAADFARLGEQIQRLEDSGAKALHLDIMDGHFVPNISFGFPVVESVRRVTNLWLDVHLMISDPARYVRRFRDAGADLITFHIEAVPHPTELLAEIHRVGACAGLSLNPPTPVSAVEPFLQECDLVLVMSVMPGFGGQQFQSSVLEKIRLLRHKAPPELLLSVDGGIDLETIGLPAGAGVDLFVVGTGLFTAADYGQRFGDLQAAAASAFYRPTCKQGFAETESTMVWNRGIDAEDSQ
ncbi:MAG: ribulose-phosphate 3-epimerase [Thermoguttaceae bacterium]|nr:ribulose-phosphate 3-epimerase [Thermoguttaceae bacterium]MDW8038502.1 ribulose-phosphate 3-epimerase [Thermoguttaceae bacterium]